MKSIRILSLLVVGIVGVQATAEMPPKAVIVLDDQFEKRQDIAQFKGDVLVVLYGDKEGMPANRSLGEKLDVQYHPTAKGMTPAEAAKAPVTPVPGLRDGQRSPELRVLPIACIGKVPDVVKAIIRNRIKKEAPESPVLLDFETKMKDQFGLKEGEPNLLVIDAQGRVRMKTAGNLDAPTYTKVLEVINQLRQEAAGK